MVKEVKSYDTKKLSSVGKAFTHFLALSNTAENHHRLRRLREYMLDNTVNTGLSTKEDTALGTIRRLVNVNKMSADDVIAALTSQSVEIVLTAHPTEVNRRTMLRKQQRIQTVLEQQDRPDLTHYERRQLDRQLKEEVMSIWNSDALNRTKPVPQKEASGGLAIVENVLWHSVPKYLRKLDDALKLEFGKAIPLTVSPIKIASWMGGDRDGNPNVTPEITLEVCAMSRWTAASLFSKDIKILKNSLSFKTASKELTDSTNGNREPYKVLLKLMEARLDATMSSSAAGIIGESWRPLSDNISDQPYQVKADLMDPLMMIHRSIP
jgi:phosphoenolpyruvate carboxylase